MPRRNRRQDEWLQPSRKPKGRKRPRGWHRRAGSPGVETSIEFLFGDVARGVAPDRKEEEPFAA